MWNINWIAFKFILIGLCLLCLCDYGLGVYIESNPTALSPVILVPGLGGTPMKAKLDKKTVPSPQCLKKSDFFPIWLNVTEMLPRYIDCWVDTVKLGYNKVTRKTTNTAGVEIKTPPFGNVEGVEWIDSSPMKYFDSGAYFYGITEALVNRGYVRNKNIFGAPYDFRKGPNENDDWFKRMVQLTESAYKMNHNTGVTFIVHSMGGRMILHFLQQMTEGWKNKYVKQFIALSTPWGGSVMPLEALSVGYSFQKDFIIHGRKMRNALSTFPSMVWMKPLENVWAADQIFVKTPKKNYTLRNLNEFFYDTENANAVEMSKDLKEFNKLSAPGVKMHCLYGSNVNTVERMEFDNGFKGKVTKFHGNGDGSVNFKSLVKCGDWARSPKQKSYGFIQKEFPGVEHNAMLSDDDTINYILSELTNYRDYPRVNEKLNITNLMEIRLF